MKEYIITALDEKRIPIASIVREAFNNQHAYKIGKIKFPNANYWMIGLKLN